MKLFRSSVALCALALALVAAQAASAHPSSTCALGAKSTTAKPCTANPAYGAGACAALVPLLQPLAPGVSIVGTAKNPGAPTGISCTFLANGQRQSFMVQVHGGAGMAENYASTLQQYTGYANETDLHCQDPATLATYPQAAIQTVSGLGDKAFAWESCKPPASGYILAVALKGSTYVYVYANAARVAPSLDQVEGVARTLLAKYH